MRAVVLSLLVASMMVASPPSSLHAQKDKAPKRPDLGASADTNVALAYYTFGVSMLERNPQRAAEAFYWAARLDPTWALPPYARRIALFMADPRLLVGYMNRTRRFTESKDARSLDSLELRALMLNPFLTRELDNLLLRAYLRALYGVGDGASSTRFDYFADQYLRNDAKNRVRALAAVSEGRWTDALDLYRKAVSEEPDEAAQIHVERARVFRRVGTDDSTRAELALALDKLRHRDEKTFIYAYQSKALLEHCIGLTYETLGQFEPAREAYGRALQEDLSYFPAHVRLGSVALAVGDTASALSEMDLAAQLRGDDAWVRATYGATLAQAGRWADAVVHLRKAVELEPFFATPYYLLGRAEEQLGRTAEAAQDYRGYVAHASDRDTRVADVKQRLAALGAPPGTRP
ncbi:MAG TPA: tetratricopeptide repeat protein [Gemmatimonadales bacterium]|nr:tetratricopeptide repeat protein [Gemmatimonadales bacterium]